MAKRKNKWSKLLKPTRRRFESISERDRLYNIYLKGEYTDVRSESINPGSINTYINQQIEHLKQNKPIRDPNPTTYRETSPGQGNQDGEVRSTINTDEYENIASPIRKVISYFNRGNHNVDGSTTPPTDSEGNLLFDITQSSSLFDFMELLGFTEASEEIFGCMDDDAINYNSDATVDDGSCEYEEEEESLIVGCYDTLALNYDASVEEHDPDSCFYDSYPTTMDCQRFCGSNPIPNPELQDWIDGWSVYMWAMREKSWSHSGWGDNISSNIHGITDEMRSPLYSYYFWQQEMNESGGDIDAYDLYNNEFPSGRNRECGPGIGAFPASDQYLMTSSAYNDYTWKRQQGAWVIGHAINWWSECSDPNLCGECDDGYVCEISPSRSWCRPTGVVTEEEEVEGEEFTDVIIYNYNSDTPSGRAACDTLSPDHECVSVSKHQNWDVVDDVLTNMWRDSSCNYSYYDGSYGSEPCVYGENLGGCTNPAYEEFWSSGGNGRKVICQNMAYGAPQDTPEEGTWDGNQPEIVYLGIEMEEDDPT
jgi:hypothetical protein